MSKSYRPSRRLGASSDSSRRSRQAQPDWHTYVRERLRLPHLRPEREAEAVEELAQQPDDLCREAVASGADDETIRALVDQHIPDWAALAREMTGADQMQTLALDQRLQDRASDRQDSWTRRVAAGVTADVLYSLRGLGKQPSFPIAIIGTIAIGLGLVAAVFTVFNAFVFRADAVRDPSALVGVGWAPSGGSSGRFLFTRRQYESLRAENHVFSDVLARRMDISNRIEGRPMEGQLVTGNFFQVLGVSAVLGRTLLPDDDTLTGERAVIVLSHRGWQHLVDGDPNIVGRSVLINGAPFEIVGVTLEGFRGLDFMPPDYWAPLSQIPHFRSSERPQNPGNLEVIGRLKAGMSRPTARAGLAVWASQGSVALTANQRPEDIRLYSKSTATPFSPGVLLGFSPLFIAFGLILLIGCANVANLLLARALARQREIGIRVSLGASRRRVVHQLLTESLLLALTSAACALAVSRVLLDGATSALMSTMPPELADMIRLAAPPLDFRVVAFVVVAAVISTALFGLVPALQATRFDLVRAVRGEVTRDARPGRARNTLIVVQVTASALLLICAGVFLRSALRNAAVDPGLRVEDTIIIDFDERQRAAIVAAVASEPSIAAVAASWPGAPTDGEPRAAFGSAADRSSTSPVAYRLVSHDYFRVLDIDVLSGRVFTEAEASSQAAVAVVSEGTARQIWPDGNALGQVLRLEPDPAWVRRGEIPLSASTFVVIGVVRGVAGFPIGWPEASVYLPTRLASPEATLIARAHGDPDLARRTLLDRLTPIDPNLHQVLTMRSLAALATYPLQVGFWVTMLLGAVALVLTLSGIFGVLSYLVAQRTNEIGVRIALGASTRDVIRLVLRQTLRQVTMGLVAAVALAWALSTVLMLTPVAARISNFVNLFDGVAYVGPLLAVVVASLIAAAVPTLRAARIDPAITLRQE
ncbi:MAG: ABC transporter permease [Vicinamibacterales bacterium]